MMNDRNNMILGGNTNLASAERMVGLRVCGNTKKNYGAKLNTIKKITNIIFKLAGIIYLKAIIEL